MCLCTAFCRVPGNLHGRGYLQHVALRRLAVSSNAAHSLNLPSEEEKGWSEHFFASASNEVERGSIEHGRNLSTRTSWIEITRRVELTCVVPFGAMRSISRTLTMKCVHIRPTRVIRKPEIDILPLSVSYHGTWCSLCTPLFASYISRISKPAFTRACFT